MEEKKNEEYKISDVTIKHLDYLQDSIRRMSTISFQIKGWAITIVTAVLTIFANEYSNGQKNYYLLFIPIIPTVLFWILDASFLSTERKLRTIYGELIKKPEDRDKVIAPLSFPLGDFSNQSNSLIRCMFCKTNVIMYLGIIICLPLAYIISINWGK